MSILVAAPFRNYFLLGLLAVVIAAYFSVGYHHPDEHYQVFEFANYKLGNSPATDLTWEFQAQCRPAFQPFIVFCIAKVLIILGLYNPFSVAFIVRIIMGISTWWLSCKLILFLLPTFKTAYGKKVYVFCSMFLWFIPYIGVRFSAENISGLFLFMAAFLLLQIEIFSNNKKVIYLLIIGLLLGFSLYLRIQVAFALIGIAIWMLFKQQLNWKDYLWMIISGMFSIIICLIIDRWFYGNWVLTPFNYFKVNIIEHKAADFGVSPWWYYVTSFLLTAIPPISILLLYFFFVGIWNKPKHLFTLICISFLLGHFLIGHKELRFLFPINYAFIFLACIGVDGYFKNNHLKRIHWWLFQLIVIVNTALLIFRIFSPAQEAIKYYSFMYNYAQKNDAILVALKNSPYNTVGVESNFYKPKGMIIKIAQNEAELKDICKNKAGKKLLFFNPTLVIPKELATYKIEKLYCILPDWILKFNINHWEDRSNIGTIYEIKR